MSLYHEAAKILIESRTKKTSVKSLVYTNKSWKSDQKTLFALSTEAAKWSAVLSEVVERSGILKVERALTPVLALVLVHDLFLAKRGVALPASHGLCVAVTKHKARLSAELTKARLRRGCASLEVLTARVDGVRDGGVEMVGDGNGNGEGGGLSGSWHPRWVRVNTLRTTVDEQMVSTFAAYIRTSTLLELRGSSKKLLHLDEHVPNLIAIPSGIDITTTQAYRNGQLILQDKASCFPAYLLDPAATSGDVVDACAAPGNKTTHLAAILHESQPDRKEGSRVIACEKNDVRSLTLEKMVKLAGGNDVIKVMAKQDFTKLNPDNKKYANVTSLLLDPSCSGSGIVGRDEGAITVHLPSITASEPEPRGKKRKRSAKPQPAAIDITAVEEELPQEAEESSDKLKARLDNLSAFQLRLLLHAMRFPAATRISYSTCSIHPEENENVAIEALLSDEARQGGWRVLRRSEQVDGMQKWKKRGWKAACSAKLEVFREAACGIDAEEVAEACIRCEKGSEEGTMGFFVVGFARDVEIGREGNAHGDHETRDREAEDDEWSGFGDET
ncbi:hypothetical protein LTR78_008750 [Recurvomyces mirabilis]|uniref:SAM-dependent MTase RsmB/NOP-type domain-containing protein n=1 Tax=Recurvomyces mirabilis TaxID=574656 RepID=A0AAE0WHK6_9PEZI|nr:hypothetical protein LTR78_008750 [Recurvomyces mirabilis]KAK5161012.1 hypothetical protein LTS14_000806 [Recurvomyces mirabilis]